MNAIAKMGLRIAAVAQRIVPDPFVIAVLLVAVVMVGGLLASEKTMTELSVSFATGSLATPLLAFAFKMALVLVTGHALADAPIVQRGLAAVAAKPTSTASAASLVAAVSMTLGLLNWGLGLVGGAFLAREVGRAFARREQPLNYPLVGAAGYMGLLVWHGGFSGSAPLKVAQAGVLGDAIPISETILSPLNLGVSAALFVVIPLLFFALGRGDVPEASAIRVVVPKVDDTPLSVSPGFLGRLETSGMVVLLLGSPLLVALIFWVQEKGAGAITLNFVILSFLLLGLLAHQSPQSYARSFSNGASGSAGILLQFPIYFGILAVAKDSGILADGARAMNAFAQTLGILSVEQSAPVLTFSAAAAINLVVPSGGGQWVLQAPLIADACKTFELSRGTMVMAFSYGDQVTNMLQPFWALPLLSITGLKVRDLLGYTVVAMAVAIPIFIAGLVWAGA